MTLLLTMVGVAGVVAGVLGAAWVARTGQRQYLRVAGVTTAVGSIALVSASIAAASSPAAAVAAPSVAAWLAAGLAGAGLVAFAPTGLSASRWAGGFFAAIIVTSGAYGIITPPLVGISVATATPADDPTHGPTDGRLDAASQLSRQVTALDQTHLVGTGVSPGATASGSDGGAPGLAETNCPEPSTARDCLMDYFTVMAKAEGVAVAVETAVAERDANPTGVLNQHCHEVLHTIGKTIGSDLAGGDPVVALRFGENIPDACSFGYSHGVWERYFYEMDREELVAGVATTCPSLVPNGSYELGACFHITGHALALSDMDAVPETLLVCETISEEWVGGRHSCKAGGFMELFVNPASVVAANELGDPVAILEPCVRADPAIAGNCYWESGPSLTAAAHLDWPESFAACAQVAPDAFLADCNSAVGGVMAVFAMFDPDKLLPLCEEVGPGLLSTCLRDAGRTISHYTGSSDLAVGLCDAVIPADRDACVDVIVSSAEYYRETDAQGNPAEPG